MIAVSDAVLIVASASILGIGLFRWQGNVDYHYEVALARQTQMVLAQPLQNGGEVGTSLQSNGNIGQTNAANELGVAFDNTASGVTNQIGANQGALNPTSSNGDVTTSTTDNDNESTTDIDGATAINIASANYVVQAGDSLSRIALRFNTTVSALQQINNIQGTLIRVGQTIAYPLPAN